MIHLLLRLASDMTYFHTFFYYLIQNSRVVFKIFINLKKYNNNTCDKLIQEEL
jgi:hypothetical protein